MKYRIIRCQSSSSSSSSSSTLTSLDTIVPIVSFMLQFLCLGTLSVLNSRQHAHAFSVSREIKFNDRLKKLVSQGNLHQARSKRNGERDRSRYNDRRSEMNGAQYAESVLMQALAEYDASRLTENVGKLAMRPNHFSFGIIISGYAKIGDWEGAESILLKMEHLYNDGNHNWLKPDVVKYTNVIKALARSLQQRKSINISSKKKSEKVVKRAESLLERMESSRDPHQFPNTLTYSAMIDLYAKTGNAKKALGILDKMELSERSGNSNVKPNEITYNACLNALAKGGESDGPEQAKKLLRRMEIAYKQGNRHVKPSIITYSTVMGLYARYKKPFEAENILLDALGKYKNGENNEQPDCVMYNTAISAWSKSSHQDAPLRAEKLVKIMIDEGYPNPNTVTYNSLIDAWSRSYINSDGSSIGASRAEEILSKMEHEFMRDRDTCIKPDSRTYTSLIDALAKSRHIGSARKAEVILRRMKRAFEVGNESAKPTKFSYSALIYAWAKSGEPGAAQRAESLLRETERLGKDLKPFTQTYDAVIDAYAREGNYEKAENIFNEMLIQYLGGDCDVEPSVRSYNKVLSSYSNNVDINDSLIARAQAFLAKWNAQRKEGKIHVQPNFVSATILIRMFSKKHSLEGAEGAERILKYMQTRYNAGDIGMKPDIIAISSCITAWLRSGSTHSLNRILSLYKQVLDMYQAGDQTMKPSKTFYNLIIEACLTKSDEDFFVEKAYDVIIEMFGDKLTVPQRSLCERVGEALQKSSIDQKEERIAKIDSMRRSIVYQ